MAAPVSLEEFKQRIGVEHDRRDDFFLSVIDGVSGAAEAYIGRSLLAADYVGRYDGNGKDRIVLDNYPVLSVSSVKINGADAGGWEFDNWLLMRPEGFARGLKNVEVSYRAGYERMPADIREAVMIIAVQRVNEIEGKGVRSKTLAGETVAFSTFGNSGGMPPSAFAILNEYKRKGV
ncbi:phage gp6-like head-tail connector protein [Neisseria gonorrhoeae]